MENKVFNKEQFKRDVRTEIKTQFRKEFEDATPQQVFQAVALAVKDIIIDEWIQTHKTMDKNQSKVVYYMSMEFLMGRALGNNLINICAYDDVKEALDEMGVDLNVIEDQEPDAGLGNGGLGRLAACFLDSLATLGYPAYGCGIRYQYGMFKQGIKDGWQVEMPDNWLEHGNPFEIERSEYATEVKFGGNVITTYDENGKMHNTVENYQSVIAVPYDCPIVGYNNNVVDTLRIWDARPKNTFNLESFDQGDYQQAVAEQNLARTIVEVLYPNDSHYSGKELRLKQQYFFVSASVQTAIKKYLEKNDDLRKLPEKIVFQMNDTHPTIAVAELMRLFVDEYNLEWDEAWEITTHCCAYTNHTIMSEALEKWPVDLFAHLLPRIYQIVAEINRRFILEIEKHFPGQEERMTESLAILYNGQVRMAHLAIVGSYSVNGVAQLHTEILKNKVLHDFYTMMPAKFNNKTNGITPRRFLLHGNPELAAWVTDHVGDGWIKDLKVLDGLTPLADDKKARKEFMAIKHDNKIRLAKYIKEHNGIDVDPNSIFDCQVKRLHEYKRQLLNIMHVMRLANEIRENPNGDYTPRTFIFGAKASAAYHTAKLTIKLINNVGKVINDDPVIAGRIKVVFIENYNVSSAELIVAGADVSEQISTASKEASGTGNMKFMLNGAPTLGTMDGANVEIVEEVGRDNAFIFGLSSDEVINFEQNGGYYPRGEIDNNPALAKVMNQLIDGTYTPGESNDLFRDLYNMLVNVDTYFTLKDFESYCQAQQAVAKAYTDKDAWARMALLNTAKSGKFSSDRTIQQYVDDIWHLEPITVTMD